MKNFQPKIHFVPKGWGFEKWIVNKKEYCGKLLYFVKGKKCSLHYHKLKDEVFYVQRGKIKLYFSDELDKIEEHTNKEGIYVSGSSVPSSPAKLPVHYILDEIILLEGDNFHIPPGRVHQIVALEETELFEFSTQHFDEDSFRILKGD